MAQSIYIGIHIAVIAAGAGVGRIALLRAGGISYGILIVMTKRLNLTGFIILATRTISALLALFRAGGSFRLCPRAEVMAQSIYIGIHIAVIAAGTGVGRIALFRAGRVSYGILIVVTKRLKLACFSFTASGTGAGFFALFRTGWLLSNCPIAETMGNRPGIAADITCCVACVVVDMLGIAGLVAAGRAGVPMVGFVLRPVGFIAVGNRHRVGGGFSFIGHGQHLFSWNRIVKTCDHGNLQRNFDDLAA